MTQTAPLPWARAGLIACLTLLAYPEATMSQAPTKTETEPPRHTNHLASETSPYLLQHAHNPVDWYAWGPEAFAEAKRRDVPIFLSVGYSTCYWCHVMERESFENETIAAIMNEHFVCIKVDREERPDVDDIYMAAVQLMTGRGGWPMSVWLTPPGAQGPNDRGLQPFFGGTYFPAEPRGQMTTFPQLLTAINDGWTTNRQQVLIQAARLAEAVEERLANRNEPVEVGAAQVEQATAHLMRIYDAQNAGFGQAPKFPQPVFANFLFEVLPTIEDPAVRNSVTRALRHTLDRMATGGMYDQVGGGFHRYSTDQKWLVPHFEKMLYDNGQLVSLYARSYMRNQANGGSDPLDAEIIRETLDYVLREMVDAGGAFHSAQDAEVNHREGENYLWRIEQINDLLDEDDAAFIAKVYGVDQGTNFQDPHHPEDARANVLFLTDRPDNLAKSMSMDQAAFDERVRTINTKMYDQRMTRDQPILDDKVLTAWNGLMIAGMADGARALNEPKYLEAAQRAAKFILSTVRDEAGLLRAYRDGSAKTAGFLVDYAMLSKGLLALHVASEALGKPNADHLADAAALVDEALARYEDPKQPGVIYDTLPEQSDLLVRTISDYDGAVPAGQSVLINSLITLHELTGDAKYLNKAAELLAAMSSVVSQNPVSPVNTTRALHRLLQLDPEAFAGIKTQVAPSDDNIVRVDESPVQVFAGTDRLTIKQGEDATLAIELRIEKGYHVTANDPGIPGLIPLTVAIDGGTGVEIETSYPESIAYAGEALPPEDRGKMMVYAGTMRLDVTLRRTEDEWTGRPMLLVTYQACDDQACFQPITVELDVAIDPG